MSQSELFIYVRTDAVLTCRRSLRYACEKLHVYRLGTVWTIPCKRWQVTTFGSAEGPFFRHGCVCSAFMELRDLPAWHAGRTVG